jgi:single-stranded DNA-specific DHH superfamily exonuclease
VVAYAIRAGGVKLSVRSSRKEVPANELVRALVDGMGLGGGHKHMAGGYIPAEKLEPGREGIAALLKQRAMAFFDQCCARSRSG